MLFGSKLKLELYIEFETADPRLEVLFMYTNLGGCAVMSPKYSSDTELKAAIGDLVLCIGTVFQIQLGCNPDAELVIAFGDRAFCIGIAAVPIH